jgi:hypothetical protein
VLSYSSPQPPRFVRLTLEELAVLGAGIGQYWYDKNENSRDWQFKYNWAGLRARLDGEAYAFDTNGYDTNFLFHPTSGTFYYLVARSNHLNAFESLAVAFGSSLVWEFFGEFQEKISINDVVVTPLAGMAWGETSLQLGAYFLRACPSIANDVLGATFAPLHVLHDAADGATRLDSECNAEARSAHRFRFSLSGGEGWTAGVSPYPFVRLSAQTEVLHLPGFGKPGRAWRTFANGNVSRLGFAISFAEPESVTVTDVALLTQTVVAGVHYRQNVLQGKELRRGEALFGLLIGAEYTRHRYDPAGAADRIFLLDLPALTTRYYGHVGELGCELTLDAGGTFGGADSFALPRALREKKALSLTSVALGEGYNHVVGFEPAPRARLELKGAEFGLDFRADRMVAFRVLDRTGEVSTTSDSELRRRGSIWISVGAPLPARFVLSANWSQRSGSVGDVHASLDELSWNAGVELAP